MPENRTDWQTWLAAHGPAAQLYARQFTASFEDAQDALHDGFVRFWPRRTRAREPLALFFACVRSAAIDRQRSSIRRQKRDRGTALSEESAANDVADLAQRELVEAALTRLPAEQREVVVLKIWAGLTFQQIAETSGESINTISARYRYGLEKLEGLLSPEMRHE